MNLYFRNYIKPNIFKTLLRYSSSVAEAADVGEAVLIPDDEELHRREEELRRKQNVSRLSENHFNLVNGRRPYLGPKCLAHKTVKYNRKLYGKYGVASGINPSLCWPSKKDIQEKLEYEAVAYPFTIPQMIEMAAEKKKREETKIELREKDVAAKFAKLEQWKQDLHNRIAKKEAEASLAKDKKERLVEEVRRHFGFKLDPRDDRFKEMLAKREKEMKKKEKVARKEAKEKVLLAQLQQKATD